MPFVESARQWVRRVRRRVKKKPPPEQRMKTFEISLDEALDRRKGGALEEILFKHKGRTVKKWVDYVGVYDKFFSSYRDTKFNFLEIGVSEGGSLDLWRTYFGDQATIYGVDIDPNCVNVVSEPNQVRIGSQDDPEFLAGVVDEMGGVDVVLDDGSHVGRHQIASFQCLWPKLSSGGLYVIEDVHTAYWDRFEGGHGRPGTAIDLAKGIVDDIHAWFHAQGTRFVSQDEIEFISVYESMIIVKKGVKLRPGHIKIS